MTTILPLYHSEDFAILTTSTDRLVFPYAGITQVRFKGCVLSPLNRLIEESTPNNLYFLSAAMLQYSGAKVKGKINEVEISKTNSRHIATVHGSSSLRRSANVLRSVRVEKI